MKNWGHVDLFITVGVNSGKAAAVTLEKSAAVAAASTALAFTKYYSTGIKLKYTTPSTDTPAAKDETVAGAGGAAATLYQDTGSALIMHSWDNDTFVTGETVTLSGGKTVVADGIQINEDIMVPRVAASNTFNIAAKAAKQYCIPIDAADLGDGYDCIQVEIADCDTVTHLAIDAIFSKPRYGQEIAETAIYD
ncbi:MAG: hypothetical protein NTV01_21845 [Bacteroidia bacterium]|nr:hypothetical protein [Bacteroidia bacterium]